MKLDTRFKMEVQNPGGAPMDKRQKRDTSYCTTVPVETLARLSLPVDAAATALDIGAD